MYDYRQNSDGDLDMSKGDLILTEPTEQHQCDILMAAQGAYKETPERGVDSVRFMHDSDPQNYLRTIRKQFTKDGMKVKDISYSAGELLIEAYYEDD